MRPLLLLATAAAWCSFSYLVTAQSSGYNYEEFMSIKATQVPTTTYSPQEIASMASASSAFNALITNPVQGGSAKAGDAASVDDGNGNIAGASGGEQNSIQISKSGIIAIAVVVSCVVVFGIVSSVLFYLAKKRSWEVRARIHRSAKRVATALTPRRTTFPKDIMSEPKKQRGRGMLRIDEVSPTPRLTSHDIEKAHIKADAIEMREPRKWAKWVRPRSER